MPILPELMLSLSDMKPLNQLFLEGTSDKTIYTEEVLEAFKYFYSKKG